MENKLSTILSNIKYDNPYYDLKREVLGNKEELSSKWGQRHNNILAIKNLPINEFYNLIALEEFIDRRIVEIEQLYHLIYPNLPLFISIHDNCIRMDNQGIINTKYDIPGKTKSFENTDTMKIIHLKEEE